MVGPSWATLAILDNLGWYCDVANLIICKRLIQIVPYIIETKIEESLNIVVKFKLLAIFEIVEQNILV